MNIKALITAAIVIGSSSLALARPGHDRDSAEGGVEVQSTVDVRDHRAYQPAPAPAPVYTQDRDNRDDHDRDHDRDNDQKPASWGHPPIFMTLAASTKITNGRDVIRFGATQPLRTIKLQATAGRTQVSEVAIKFANGQTQLVYPNKTLSGQACIDIDLTGSVRNVKSIVVYGRSNSRSSFEVLGA